MRIICVSGSEANFRRVYEAGLRKYCAETLDPPLISASWPLPEDYPETLRFIEQERPFHFGREINRLIALAWRDAPLDDILLIEDDAPLSERSELNYGSLHYCHPPPDAGMVSAAVLGPVCNLRQNPNPEPHVGYRDGGDMLAVMTVWMRGRALYEIEDRSQPKDHWWWDERFTGYGYDDDDVCRRMREKGWKMYVHDGLIVDHQANSVWRRDEAAVRESMARNQALYVQKWGDLK